MSEVDKNLSSILEIDITPTEEPEVLVGEIVPSEDTPPATVANTAVEPVAVLPDRDVDYDYAFSRITHRDLIEKGMPALDDLLKVAKESQHPRAYEVAANMMKSLSDMTDKLMVLQKQRKELKAGKEEKSTGDIRVDKAVFVGSTAELLKQIKQNE
jgi:hypothetical protein